LNLKKRKNLEKKPKKRKIFIKKKLNNVSKQYLINLMSNLIDIESLLKHGNNPINVFTEKLINLS